MRPVYPADRFVQADRCSHPLLQRDVTQQIVPRQRLLQHDQIERVEPDELVAESEVVVVGAPHDVFRELESPSGKPVVDVWGFYRRTPVVV